MRSQFGGSKDNLIKTFDSTSNPALADLAGQQIQGNWVLRVADLEDRDIGIFNKWSVELSQRAHSEAKRPPIPIQSGH